ncbi:alpha/beta fold hydrolase [Paenarthrobacter sp. NPDC058040]|uniref:alpha/beta fold hydrolase n=1 Tax=unclassified Paenarthrobacter TaxID=2634190 RepID=UPI0036DB79DC
MPISDLAEIQENQIQVSDQLVLHYKVSGSGPMVVVFVPGWTMSSQVFEHQLLHLAGSSDYSAIAYDPRSQGSSTTTMEGHYYEQHAKDLHGLIEGLGIQDVIFVAWSAGSGDVLEYIRMFGSENVRGLVLLDIPPKVRGFDRELEWVDFGTKDNGDQDGQLKFFCSDLLLDRLRVTREFSEWMLDDPSEENLDFFVRMSTATPDSIAAQLIMSFIFLDNTRVVEELDATIPLLYFTRSEWQALATKWATEHTPRAVVESFGKHAMFWEHPETFNAALDRFLTRCGLAEEQRRNGHNSEE